MKCKQIVLRVAAMALIPCVVLAADWNEWRGPNRDGVVPGGPALLDTWPKEGPPQVWQSGKIPGGDRGGYGSLVVADGRVFVYVSPKERVPLTTRTLSEASLKRLGWPAPRPPEALLKTIGAARLSKERADIKDRKAVMPWAKKWVADNLDTDARKKFGRWATDRLRRGASVLAVDILDKLAAIKGRDFENQAALDAWLAKNGIAGSDRKTALAAFSTTKELGYDEVVCLDAATGKRNWSKRFPGKPRGHGSSNTPTVSGGRCYVIGSDSDVYCLNAETGHKVWQAKVGAGERHSSFVVVDGVAVIPGSPPTGFDAATGEVLWTLAKHKASNSSPVIWWHGGKAFVVMRTYRKTVCVEPKTGRVLWTVGNWGDSTPVVTGDTLVAWHSHGISAWRLTPEKAEPLWTTKTFNDYAASPVVVDGHVYAMGSKGAICLDLAKGAVKWEKKVGTSDYISPVAADGKMLVQAAA